MTHSDRVVGENARGKNGAAYTQHLLKVAYECLLPDLINGSPHLGLTIDGDPMPLGSLARAVPPTLDQADLDRLWAESDPLYGLGVIEPHLHVGKDDAPVWTLTWTVLLCASPTSKKPLKALRRELDSKARIDTFKIEDGVPPFAPMGSRCSVLRKPKGATMFEPLSGVPAGEALAWVHTNRTLDRVMLRGLRIGQTIGSLKVDLATWTYVPDIRVRKLL